MSWVAVARRDVREIVQLRSTRWLLYLLVAVFAFGAYVFPAFGGPPPVSMADFPGYLTDAVTLYVPLVGVVIGHKAIVAERESGELALTLSLPHTRREAVLGKCVARGGLLAAAVLAGLLIAFVLVVYPYGSFEPLIYLGYTAVTLLFAEVFLGLAVAVSTVTARERVATAIALGAFALFVVIWHLVRDAVAVALEAIGLTAGPLPEWALFLLGLEPVSAYRRVVESFWGGGGAPGVTSSSPWYFGGWVAILLLVAWALVPLGLGYYRFRRADL